MVASDTSTSVRAYARRRPTSLTSLPFCALMTSDTSVLNHSEFTPVFQDATSSLFTAYATDVYRGVLTSAMARRLMYADARSS